MEFGDSQFNMSLQTLKRIDTLLILYHQFKRMEFYKGNPLYTDILSILNSIYVEVRPQLKEEEKGKGDIYRYILNSHPAIKIKINGDNTIVPKAAISLMEEWMDWLMEMLYTHKMLMAVGDDLSDVIE